MPGAQQVFVEWMNEAWMGGIVEGRREVCRGVQGQMIGWVKVEVVRWLQYA
jgi:hypothetical protein